jgi:tetratricopeptide (TPR) repeat protein
MCKKPWALGNAFREGPKKVGRRAGLYSVGLLCIILLAGYIAGRRRTQLARRSALEAAELERPELAMPLFEDYLANVPDDGQAWGRYAQCRQQVAEPKQAHLSKAIEAYQMAAELRPQDAQVWLGLARLHSMLGNVEGTLNAAKQTLRLDPKNSDALGLLVDAQIKNGASSELRAFIEKHRSSHDWKTGLLLQDAQLALGSSPPEMFESYASRMTEPRSQNSLSIEYMLAARLAMRAGDRAEAVELLESGLTSAPMDLEYLRTVVRISTDLQAEVIGVRYIARFPGSFEDPYLALWYARRQWERGNLELVIAALESQPERPLATEPEANLLLCLALHRLGRLERLKDLLKRLETESKLAEVSKRWFELISLLDSADQADDQVFAGAAQRVLEVNPASPIVRLMHASVYYRQGEYELAARLSGDALRLAPSWMQLWHFHVTSLALSGQIANASQVAASMVRKFPDEFDAQLCDRLLKLAQLSNREDFNAADFIRWADQVDVSRRDYRRSSVDVIRNLAAKASRASEDTTQVKRDPSPSVRADGGQTLQEQLQEVLLKNYFFAAYGPLLQIPSAQLGLLGTSKNSSVLADGEMFSGVTKDSCPSEDSVISILKDTIQNPTPEKIDELKSRTPKGAIHWRILEARRLLQSGSERDAASAVAVLRPVVAQIKNHADANLLLGLAMFRLQDSDSAIEHWYRAVPANDSIVEQCMRLSLTLRKQGFWKDEKSLVMFWNNVTAGTVQSTGETTKMSRRIEENLLLLSAYAEETDDAGLAQETYRTLLRQNEAHGVALNNLAYLLLQNGGSLTEALRLSERALRVSPDHEEFQATHCEIVQASANARTAANTSTSKGN